MALADVLARMPINAAFSAADRTTITNVLTNAYNNSATAKAMFDSLVTNNKTVQINTTNNNFFEQGGNIFIDLAWLANNAYVDKGGTGRTDTADTAILHELVHAIQNIGDTSFPGDMNSTDDEGATVTFVNVIYKELGFPEQASYDGYTLGGFIVPGTNYSNNQNIDSAFFVTGTLDAASLGNTKDVFIGTDARQNMKGGQGDDHFFGNGGNDIFRGDEGDDVIDGGAGGADIAVYSGLCFDYEITENANGSWTIRDTRAGSPDGTDILTNVEQAKFLDGKIDLIPGQQIICPGLNIVLAIDVSGSMSDDIDAVKQISRDMVDVIYGSTSQPIASRLGIVLFGASNPTPTVALSFTDQMDIGARKAAALSAINGLSFTAGGTELQNSAILTALNGGAGAWDPKSFFKHVIVFTDEDADDPNLQGQVIAAAQNLDTTVTSGNPIAPASTAGVNTRAPSTNPPFVDDTISTSNQVLLSSVIIGNSSSANQQANQLATATGGQVFNADPSDPSSAAQALLNALQVIPGTTANDDDISGTSQDNRINGAGGDDTLRGFAGDDTLDGGAGNDSLLGDEGDDSLAGGADNDTLLGGLGNDMLNPGAGTDLITGGGGDDTIHGSAPDLFGDTVTDFGVGDAITVLGSLLTEDALIFTPGASATVGLDTNGDGTADGTINTPGAMFDDTTGALMTVQRGGNTQFSFETFLPTLSEATDVGASNINGVNNQMFITGELGHDFRATLDANAAASFDNALGLYEIDANGNIVDVRILFDSAKTGAGTSVNVTGIDAGNQIGLFLIQDGADFLDSLAAGDTFSFVNTAGDAADLDDGSDLFLAINGTADPSLTIFHSFDETMNMDGQQHVLSGVTQDGQSVIFGFEDITNLGDSDFQDLIVQFDYL